MQISADPVREATMPRSSRQRWLLGAALAVGVFLAGCGDDSVTTGSPLDDADASVAAEAAPPPDTPAATPDPAEATVTTEAATPDPAEATVTTEAATPDPAEATVTTEAATPDPVAAATVDHSYSEGGVHEILEQSCASCHAAGGPGSGEMELVTADDAVTNADEIGLATQTLVMPPWPASDLSLDFVGDHSLSDADIDAITTWVDAGGTIDIDPATPIVSSRPIQRIEDPDLVVTSANGPYQGSTAVVDDYRCLVFDPAVTETEWILASHFEPDQVEVVHHGIIHLASEELRAEADAKDAAEPGPGWTCYGLGQLDDSNGGYQFRMAGWAPGAQPARQPAGYAIPLRPGDFLIVQVHYHFDEGAAPDLSRMVFDLASDDDLAAAGGSFDSLQGALYLGPAEIPCYEGDTDPLCDREVALERVRDLYGEFAAILPDYFLGVCRSRPADYAAMTDGTAWSTCDLPVENPGRIVSVAGHMHELGLSIRLTLNPGTPDEVVLLDIPNWNFEWQFGYQPVDDIIIGRGDTIRIDCAWNRERAPYEAVGYVLWADGTGDEMCYSNITTAPLD